MMLTIIRTEHNSPNFSVSYDDKHDLIRLSNKSVSHFSYEHINEDSFIMIDDQTNEVIGAQMFNFITNKRQTLETINRLEYKHLKIALSKSLDLISNKK